MDEQNIEKFSWEDIKNIRLSQFYNMATIVSVAMITYYTLGAIKYWRELKK